MVGYRVGVVFNPLAETEGILNSIVGLISLTGSFLQVIYVKYDS